MPRKSTRKNYKKIRGGEDPQPSSTSWFSMPSMPSFSTSMPSLPTWLGGPEKKTEETVTTYPTEGGKKKRRRRIRGGSYSPNSSYYGSNAGPYSGSPTARAQAYVGGRTRRKKRR